MEAQNNKRGALAVIAVLIVLYLVGLVAPRHIEMNIFVTVSAPVATPQEIATTTTHTIRTSQFVVIVEHLTAMENGSKVIGTIKNIGLVPITVSTEMLSFRNASGFLAKTQAKTAVLQPDQETPFIISLPFAVGPGIMMQFDAPPDLPVTIALS